jgi:hypothetical protein
MAKKLGLFLVGLLLISTLVLAGCGGSGGVKTTQSGDADVSASQEVNPFEDIPTYAGAKTITGDFSTFTSVTANRITGSTAEWHYYEVKTSDQDAIQNYYKTALPGEGWISLNSNVPSVEGMTYSMFMKAISYAIIMTFPDPSKAGNVVLAICRTSVK